MAKKGKKGKGGKKKGSSKSSALNRDQELLQAVTNSKLWQNKLVLTERQRDDYRETCQKLADENETVTNSLYQAERDTIEIITILKREDIAKDKQIQTLTMKVEDLQKITDVDRAALAEEYEEKRLVYETQLAEKREEITLLQKELRSVKEFRKNKSQITEELKDLYEQLEKQKLENEENKQKMEQKFFVEKNKMEREKIREMPPRNSGEVSKASHKIGQYAERAQKEAIAAMDETTRKVFRDNVQMSEVMSHHIERKNELEQKNTKLTGLLKQTRQECEINEITVREKVAESRKAKSQIAILEEKLSSAVLQLDSEKADFHNQKALVLSNAIEKSAVDRGDILRLQQTLALREREMTKMKLLARKVVDERSLQQKFFIEALDEVCREIKYARADYVKKSKQHYNATMAAAATGRAKLPKVKTFIKGDMSTNNVTKDLEVAEDWTSVTTSTDISELTWEQKEKVIRLLFAKMNGVGKEKKIKRLPPITSDKSNPPTQLKLGSSKSALSELDALQQAQLSKMEMKDNSSTFITQTV